MLSHCFTPLATATIIAAHAADAQDIKTVWGCVAQAVMIAGGGRVAAAATMGAAMTMTYAVGIGAGFPARYPLASTA